MTLCGGRREKLRAGFQLFSFQHFSFYPMSTVHLQSTFFF